MDLHFQELTNFPKRYKLSMRNTTVPEIVCHLKGPRLCSGIQKAGGFKKQENIQ